MNVHFHTLATDGVFVQRTPHDEPVFHALLAPTNADIAAVARDTNRRAVALLRKRGMWLDGDNDSDGTPAQQGEDPLAQDEPALAALAGASIQGTLLLGPRAGQRALRLQPARGQARSRT